jgi:hypothetical protein
MYNYHPEEVTIAAIKNPSLPIEYLEKFILLETAKIEPNTKFIKAAKSVLSKRQTL